MTKEQCLSINGLNKKQLATIKRYFWEAEKKGKECKLEACATAEEVVAMVNASFKGNVKQGNQTPNINLTALSIEQLENLMNEIPQVIAEKRAEKLSEIEAKIKELEELKAELIK